MKKIISFWKFSRPHTIIGTTVSIITLYLLTNKISDQSLQVVPLDLVFTLISCLGCNVFITGLNQIYDIEIDRLNKPNLPLVNGEISLAEAKKIVTLSLTISLFFAFFQGFYFGGLISIIALIGAIYTIPPIRLKKHHLWAAISISLVRGPLVNLGVFCHFYMVRFGFPIKLNIDIMLLTAFITVFSVGIAWFKDIPDVEGDLKNNIQTLSVKYSKQKALIGGLLLVGLVYILSIFIAFLPFLTDWMGINNPISLKGNHLIFGFYHIVALSYFVYRGLKVNVDTQAEIKKFYMTYWILFFFEYLVFAFL